MNNIQRPFTAIMGGSKVSSKIEIIENLLNKVDNLIVTGGMTYTFTKAQGGKIGLSICEDDKLDLALELMQKAKDKGVNLVLAVDAKIGDSFSNDCNSDYAPVNEIPDGGRIIKQKAVEILDGDTPEVLQKRVMEQTEWIILPEATEEICAEIVRGR